MPYDQLPQQDPGDPAQPEKPVLRWASLRIYYLAAVLCCGGALFGYDSGVIGNDTSPHAPEKKH